MWSRSLGPNGQRKTAPVQGNETLVDKAKTNERENQARSSAVYAQGCSSAAACYR